MSPIFTKCIIFNFYTDFIYDALALQLLHSWKTKRCVLVGKNATSFHTHDALWIKCALLQVDWDYLELQPPL